MLSTRINNRFSDAEMQIVRETDLPELLTHLGYQVRQIGRYHTTAEMDSLRIKDRRTSLFPEYRRGRDHLPAAVPRQKFSGSCGVPPELPRQGQRLSRENNAF